MADQKRNLSPDVRSANYLVKFLSNQEGFVTNLKGHEITWNYAEFYGFSNPIKVERVEGLDLQVPVGNYNHFLNRLGAERMVSVIHVETDSLEPMTLGKFIHCVTHPEQDQTYCMQSLELTSTEMKNELKPPEFVRSIDLIEGAWSRHVDNSESNGDESEADPELNGVRPEVSRFLQINMAGSYINFHLDASGSGIWHHVLRGTEVLYLIKGPVEKIATKYDEWYLKTYSQSSTDSESSDATDTSMNSESSDATDSLSPMKDDDELEFHRVVVSEGETIFLPGGFFRAMQYPEETIVVGGNYLNIFNLDTHLRIYKKETNYAGNRKLCEDFMFPKFGEACWRFAHHMCRKLIGARKILFSHRIYDQLRNLYQHLCERKGFDRVSKELKKVGLSKILRDLNFILREAEVDTEEEGYHILRSRHYSARSF